MIYLTPRLLQSIAKDIFEGRALWGALRANEYTTPVSKALRKKAARNISYGSLSDYEANLVAQVLEGKKMGEFESWEQKRIKLIHSKLFSENQQPFVGLG